MCLQADRANNKKLFVIYWISNIFLSDWFLVNYAFVISCVNRKNLSPLSLLYIRVLWKLSTFGIYIYFYYFFYTNPLLILTGLWGWLRLSREDNFTSVVTHEDHSLQPVLAVVRQLQVNIGQAAVTVKIHTCLTSQKTR